MTDINMALLPDFIVEAAEHLDEIEALLLQLGDDPENLDILNDVFRPVHNIKGGSQFACLDKISRLAHRLEDLLDLLRRGSMPSSAETVDLLIAARDRIALIVNELEETQEEQSSVDDLVDQITECIETGGTVPTDTVTAETGSAPSVAVVEGSGSAPVTEQDEEHDQELYGIFINHQGELLEKLQQQVVNLDASVDMVQDLQQCVVDIKHLWMASNYMGYTELADQYQLWGDAINQASTDWGQGDKVSLDFMNYYFDRVRELLPHISGVDSDADAPPPASVESAPSVAAADDGMADDVDHEEDVSAFVKGAFDDHEDEDDDDTTPNYYYDEEDETTTAEQQASTAAADDNAVPNDEVTTAADDYDATLAAAAEESDEQNMDEPAQDFTAAPMEHAPSEINIGMLPDFILECREHLDEMEAILLQLSDTPNDIELLNDVFRPVHNIKGGSQFTCLDKISRLSHRLEDLLDLCRQGKKESNSSMVDLFIDTRDRIAQIVNELEASQVEQSQIDDLVAQLNHYIEQAGGTVVIGSEPVQASVVESAESPIEKIEYDEEDDQELFGIFVTHLKDQLAEIHKQRGELVTATDQEEGLNVCDAVLSRLWSAANYMDYDYLTTLYDDWRDDIQDAIDNAQQGQVVDVDFIDGYVDRIEKIFPQLLTMESTKAQVTPAQSVKSSEPVEEKATPAPTAPVASAPQVSTAAAVTKKLGQAFSKASSNELFERLNNALDSTVNRMSKSEYDTLNTVYDEMVSPRESFAKAKAAAKKTLGSIEQSVPAGESSKKSDSGDKKIKKSLRVDADKIDSLMNQVGELVVDRAYFFQLFGEMRDLQKFLRDAIGVDKKEMKALRTFSYKLGEAIASLGRTSNELQEGVMKMRMLPISQIFNRYPRLVRDLTHNSDKKVNLVIRGGDTELDKMIVEELSDPLIHIIRNAVDHGIEPMEERVRRGKPESGTMELEAYQESNHIVIEVHDDGRGIDPAVIRRKVVEKGLFNEEDLERFNDKDISNLILTPGFSTAEKITGTSGRGVGMDIVKKNIEKLNGTLDINSKPGQGTQMRLKIPLTLAIIHALMIRVGEDLFTIPLANVDETVRISQGDTSTMEGVEVIHLRGDALPIFRLSTLFNTQADEGSEKSFVVIVSTEGQRTGFIVDELIGQDEVVIKPLADYVQEKSGFSGATIVGDGRISLILDVYELVKMTANKQAKKQQHQTAELKSRIRRRPDVQQAAGGN